MLPPAESVNSPKVAGGTPCYSDKDQYILIILSTYWLGADQAANATAVKARIRPRIRAEITITPGLCNTHELSGRDKNFQYTQILPEVQLSGTLNVTVVYAPAVHLV